MALSTFVPPRPRVETERGARPLIATDRAMPINHTGVGYCRTLMRRLGYPLKGLSSDVMSMGLVATSRRSSASDAGTLHVQDGHFLQAINTTAGGMTTYRRPLTCIRCAASPTW